MNLSFNLKVEHILINTSVNVLMCWHQRHNRKKKKTKTERYELKNNIRVSGRSKILTHVAWIDVTNSLSEQCIFKVSEIHFKRHDMQTLDHI